jgi:hypothetical protein
MQKDVAPEDGRCGHVGCSTTALKDKTLRSLGEACLFSFVLSGVATLLICALAPVRSVSLPARSQNLPDRGRVGMGLSVANALHLEAGREEEEGHAPKSAESL